MGENIYMLPSDMNLKFQTGTVRYNNKILVSDGKFSLGKNDKVNSLVLGHMGPASGEPVIPMPKDHSSHKVVAQQTHAHELSQKPTQEEEKLPFFSFWQVVLSYGIFFDENRQTHVRMLHLAILPLGTLTTWDLNHLGF